VAPLELLELIELEIRELLNSHGYPGEIVPVIRGSPLVAEEKSSGGSRAAIARLLEALDASAVGAQ
jgi:elongation factor Tu